MICPHCKLGIHEGYSYTQMILSTNKAGNQYGWRTKYQLCPECRETIIHLEKGAWGAVQQNQPPQTVQPSESHLVWPQQGSRQCPPAVPDGLKKDFLEAAAILPKSPQASAALTRRCLQHLLRDYGKAKTRDLADQIDEIASSLPVSLSDQLHAVRNIGNFAAHPQKSTNSGEILEVEPQEAEWNLEVLEELFDHYFVKPAILLKRKEALNKKLAEAGKPLIA
jgi:hypothetical protein